QSDVQATQRVRSPGAEAVQMPSSPHVDLAINEGRRREDVFAELRAVQHLPVGLGADHRQLSLLAKEIHLAVAADGRAVVIAPRGKAIVLERLAGLRVER